MKKSTKFFVFGGLICLLAGMLIMLVTGAAGGMNIVHELVANYGSDNVRTIENMTEDFDAGDFDTFAGTKEISVSENDVSSIKIVINGGEVSVREGYSDCIEICTDSYGLDYAVENGTLMIKEEKNRLIAVGGQEIVVYLPKNVRFDDLEMAIGGGELEADSLKARCLTLQVGAGEAYIENIDADSLDISVGAGNVTVERGRVSKDAAINVGLGEVYFCGYVEKNADLKCGMGELCFYGEEMDPGAYDYDMKCGAGNISLNGNDYSGMGLKRCIDNGSEKAIEIDCGMGEVDIDFSLF